jgi:glycosyltransferase involved in cell wall biosynthesis
VLGGPPPADHRQARVDVKLALGTPVLGYRRGCLPELLDDRTGLLAEPGDEEGLAALLPLTDRLDPHACREAARTRFSPGGMAEKYLQLHDDVLDRARMRPRPALSSALR